MGHKRATENKRRNSVAKFAREFNKAHTFADRKQKAKRGYTKHKKGNHNAL